MVDLIPAQQHIEIYWSKFKYLWTNPRILTLGQLDLTNYNQFEFTTIAGTSNNGGENCDAAEDLKISYSTDNGTTYTQITVLDAEDARFTEARLVS